MNYSRYLLFICIAFQLGLKADWREEAAFSAGVVGSLLVPSVVCVAKDINDPDAPEFLRAALIVGGITLPTVFINTLFDKKITGALGAVALSGYCVSAHFASKKNNAYGGQEPSSQSKQWWFLAGAGMSAAASSVGLGCLWLARNYWLHSTKPLFTQSWQSVGLQTGGGSAVIAAAAWLRS